MLRKKRCLDRVDHVLLTVARLHPDATSRELSALMLEEGVMISPNAIRLRTSQPMWMNAFIEQVNAGVENLMKIYRATASNGARRIVKIVRDGSDRDAISAMHEIHSMISSKELTIRFPDGIPHKLDLDFERLTTDECRTLFELLTKARADVSQANGS